MKPAILKTFTVTISLQPGMDLTERGWEAFDGAYSDMLDDGDLAARIEESLIEAGLHRDVLECLHIIYKEK